MIIGMAPMALGLGEGGEQNAPLGRAVVGGLICATIATLMFVPVVFSILHERRRQGATPGDWRTACRLIPLRQSCRAAGFALSPASAAAVAAIVVVMGITTRKMADAKLSEWTETQAVPVVAVATPDTRGKNNDLRSPGRGSRPTPRRKSMRGSAAI